MPRFSSPTIAAMAAFSTCYSGVSHAACTYVMSGALSVKVSSCRSITGSVEFGPNHPDAEQIWNRSEAERKKFEHTYDGVLIKGIIARVKLAAPLPKGTKPAGPGATVDVFIKERTSCDGLENHLVSGTLTSECCDGVPDVPCLLHTALKLGKIDVK